MFNINYFFIFLQDTIQDTIQDTQQDIIALINLNDKI